MKVSFERVQTCTIHTSFSIFNCGWCCNGHKWWALHDQRHLKCVGTRPEGPCPLHNFVPTIDHIHVEICTKKLFQAAMIFFLPAAGPYQVWYQDLYMVNWSLTLLKKNFACGDLGGYGPSWQRTHVTGGEWIVWSGIKKHDIVTQRVHTKIHLTNLQNCFLLGKSLWFWKIS